MSHQGSFGAVVVQGGLKIEAAAPQRRYREAFHIIAPAPTFKEPSVEPFSWYVLCFSMPAGGGLLGWIIRLALSIAPHLLGVPRRARGGRIPLLGPPLFDQRGVGRWTDQP